MDLVVTSLIGLVVAAVILMIVDRLNLGLSVGGFVNAIIAAIAIAVVAWLLGLVLTALHITLGGGILGFIAWLIASALVLVVAAKVVPNFTTTGFTGAMIAAIAIAVLNWLVSWLLGVMGISFG